MKTFALILVFHDGFLRKKFRCPRYYAAYKIKGVRVGPENKEAPWNTRYRPDVPEEGMTVAIAQTKDIVHVKEYSPYMTFHDLVLKVI